MYEFNLFEDMKIYSIFHISLLLLSKHNLMKQQVSELSFIIIESEEDSYFINSIDDIK